GKDSITEDRIMKPWSAALTTLALASLLGTVAVAEDAAKAAKDAKPMKGDATAAISAAEAAVNEAVKNHDMATFNKYVDPMGWSADPSGVHAVSEAAEMLKTVEIRSYTIENEKTIMIDKDAYVHTYVWKG